MRHQFISYSALDAKDFALRLADELAAGPPSIRVWLDARELKPGLDWDEQIGDAIDTCDNLLFVMSRDSVTPNSVCKKEWTQALKHRKPVIPLRLHGDAEMPFRLEPRQFIDFSGSFESGLARLRNHLQWLAGPEGVLQALKDRLADARHDLGRVPESEQPRIESEIAQLQDQIARRQRLVENSEMTPRPAPPESSRDSAGPSASAHAQPASSRPHNHSAGDTSAWDPAVLERATRDLAVYIGPMARVMVRRAAGSARSRLELYQALADEIPSLSDRQKFLASRPL